MDKLFLIIGTAVSINFLYQLFTRQYDWLTAFERSYFMSITALTYYMMGE